MRSRLPATMRNATLWMRRFARTTPGAISAIAVVAVVLCVLAGTTAANQMSGKIARADAVLEHTEPLAFAAQSLYVALSAADATAAEAFLSGGIEKPEVRTRYQQALADAAGALADATVGASDEQTRQIVARITAELPTYTGLVEAARANNRQGFPVGSAYLREASTLMQTSLLPTAEKLSNSRFTAVRDDQRSIATLPWTSIVLLLLVLIACGAGSYVLLRHTNRRVNLGLAFAAIATSVALLWVIAGTLIAGAAVETGRTSATARFETLAQARILAQQARTDETLQLITRGDITVGETNFDNHTAALRERLDATGGADSAAAQEFTQWTGSHDKQVAAYEAADYIKAVQQAIGADPQSSAARFTALDRALSDNLADTRQDLRDGADRAGGSLLLSPTGSLLLLIFAGAAVVIGVWPRLEEFL